MKPTSKKDDYTVECKSQSETADVLNYINNDNDRDWSHWNYVSKYDGLDRDINDSIPERLNHLSVISFEEWQKLPEYDPKDVAFKNDVYYNSEFNSESKIVGYKLIKPEYKESVNVLISQDKDSSWILENIVKSGNALWEDLYLTGILDIWFEAVYDESITLKSGVKLSEDDIAEVKKLIEMIQICKDLAK